jgi:hypothetical protein
VQEEFTIRIFDRDGLPPVAGTLRVDDHLATRAVKKLSSIGVKLPLARTGVNDFRPLLGVQIAPSGDGSLDAAENSIRTGLRIGGQLMAVQRPPHLVSPPPRIVVAERQPARVS